MLAQRSKGAVLEAIALLRAVRAADPIPPDCLRLRHKDWGCAERWH